MKRTSTAKTESKKSEQKLEQIMSLWIREGKSGKYLTGKVGDNAKEGFNVVGFYNGKKKNAKEPDIRVYESYDEGHSKDSILSLWATTSKAGKMYFTGLDNENNRIVAFLNEKADSKNHQPNIRVYYQENRTA